MRWILSILLMLGTSFLYSKQDPGLHLKVTQHTLELESGPLKYKATTGLCPIYTKNGHQADLFFISYIKKTKEIRPITFVFPGGPGGAGTIESILTFGPRRLLTAKEGRTILPPYELIDNPETLLEYTDLIFVDPVNCGYSRAKTEADLPYFYSVEGDIQILGELVHTLIDMNQRWNSPIYLSGISYGTLRCCGLAHHLFQYGIAVKGVILNGCAFEFSTIYSQRDKAMPDWLLIPTMAATAWFHKRLWPDKTLEQVVEYARKFTYEAYAPYALQPCSLSSVEKMRLENELAELIGLPLNTVKRYNSRINEDIYTAEFFGPERKVLGGLDSRYAGDISSIRPDHSHDPSYLDSIGTAPAFKHYLQKELNTYFPLAKYIGFSHEANHYWNFATWDSFGEPNLLQRLRQTLILNPLMKVFVGSGYYDCRTPFAATEYSFDHLELPSSYQKNIQFEYYEAGHGFIFDHPSLQKWKKDLTKFYELKTQGESK
jgi:carboxypeptidase C (cathepsin A)